MKIAYAGNIYAGNMRLPHLTWKWGKVFQKEGFDVFFLSDYSPSETQKVEDETGIATFSVPVKSLRSKGLLFLSNKLSEFALRKSAKDKSIQHIRGLLWCLSYLPQIEKIVKEKQIDIIHMHYMYSAVALASVFVPDVPKILSLWGSDLYINPKDSDFREALAGFIFRKVDLVHVPAKAMEEEAMRLGCPRSKLFVEPWIIDTDMFKPADRKDTEVRRRLHIGRDDVVVLSARRLSPVHGVDVIVKAIPYVIERVKNVKFIFVGDGPLKNDLEKLAKDLGVWEYVRFVDWADYLEMPSYYQSADIYVQMPSSEGLSYSLLEAMACGLPVISTPVGGNAETIEGARSGFLVEVGDYRELADRILHLIAEDRDELAKRSLDFIQKNHNKAKRIERYKEMYKAVVKGGVGH